MPDPKNLATKPSADTSQKIEPPTTCDQIDYDLEALLAKNRAQMTIATQRVRNSRERLRQSVSATKRTISGEMPALPRPADMPPIAGLKKSF